MFWEWVEGAVVDIWLGPRVFVVCDKAELLLPTCCKYSGFDSTPKLCSQKVILRDKSADRRLLVVVARLYGLCFEAECCDTQ